MKISERLSSLHKRIWINTVGLGSWFQSQSLNRHTHAHMHALDHAVQHSPRPARVGVGRDSILEESGAVCHLGNHVSMDSTSSPSAKSG
ncbi:Protein-serine O-palmitoleoyltransferase porcupine [Clarias magur]|uniref:Protein-serine O-palmitoleoyltransferase porcupine n=1 Tax=Clarias magur TaxID=1594786 RepID=A0A8J4XF18_CLAMG|nr:Protein-serine O-palmitoleoyltransferase porcupine [Clarias magur]